MEKPPSLRKLQGKKITDQEINLIIASCDPAINEIINRSPLDRDTIRQQDYDELMLFTDDVYGIGVADSWRLVVDFWRRREMTNEGRRGDIE